MRKNIADKKGLNFFYSVFKTKKSFALVILKVLKNEGIEIFDLKTQKDGSLTFKVRNKDEKKVFAISKELWYNKEVVTKIGNSGVLYPVYNLFCSLGLLLGAIFFIIFTVYSSGFVLEYEFKGSGSVYKREVISRLNENGIALYKNINGIDLDKLSDKILSLSPNLSFVEIKKEGLRLVVYLAEKESPKKPTPPVYELNSLASGEVVELKVYRGVSNVKVGDVVDIGDLLVEGYFILDEEKIKTPVIALVSVREKRTFNIASENELLNEELLALASQVLGEDYVFYNVNESLTDKERVYDVELFYDVVMIAT